MAILTHKVELVPNKGQAAFFRNCAGASRFFWNWALSAWEETYKNGSPVSDSILRKEIVRRKKGDDFPWANEIPAACISNAVVNLGLAFKNWFRSLKQGGDTGRPAFKSRHRDRPVFHPWDKSNVKVDGKRVCIPCLGFVKMRERLRFNGKILSCSSVVHDCGRWYVCLAVETEDFEKERTGFDRIGVDLGCSELAVCSNGWRFGGAKPTRKLAGRLARAQRQLHPPCNDETRIGSVGHLLGRLECERDVAGVEPRQKRSRSGIGQIPASGRIQGDLAWLPRSHCGQVLSEFQDVSPMRPCERRIDVAGPAMDLPLWGDSRPGHECRVEFEKPNTGA